MIFIETPIFTSDVKDLLGDDEYRELQQHLAINPQSGPVIQDTGGLRKVRWSAQGKGKRGGVRVIYYHVCSDNQIRMILIFDILPNLIRWGIPVTGSQTDRSGGRFLFHSGQLRRGLGYRRKFRAMADFTVSNQPHIRLSLTSTPQA